MVCKRFYDIMSTGRSLVDTIQSYRVILMDIKLKVDSAIDGIEHSKPLR
jgi:hypothetical protein